MVILKEFLAFPMFASAVWLIWVLQSQEGGRFLAATLTGVLFLGFGVWLIRRSSNILARSLCWAFFAFALAIPAQQFFQEDPPSSDYEPEKQADIDAFSVARLEELVETGPVFVNFTASWCITCKVNEVTALRTQKVMNAFQSEGITYLEAIGAMRIQILPKPWRVMAAPEYPSTCSLRRDQRRQWFFRRF